MGRKKILHQAWLLCLGLASVSAQAQIYGGTSTSGALLLSNNLGDGAEELIVEAPLAPILASATLKAALLPRSIPESFAPFIHEASIASKLPAALIHAVISAESNYNPRAVSPKGAQGLMQLMPATARRFGATNSFDPRVNILAGSRYLRWLMDYFQQDIELTVAAYNAGEMAVIQAGRKIPRFSETEKYVPKVLALYKKALQPV
jgi:soluble lytic murein transglycosylase-like protein